MLKSIARASKTVSKYSYYPIFIGLLSLCAAIANNGNMREILCWILFGVCAALSVFAFMSKYLCKKAGIDPRIR